MERSVCCLSWRSPEQICNETLYVAVCQCFNQLSWLLCCTAYIAGKELTWGFLRCFHPCVSPDGRLGLLSLRNLLQSSAKIFAGYDTQIRTALLFGSATTVASQFGAAWSSHKSCS